MLKKSFIVAFMLLISVSLWVNARDHGTSNLLKGSKAANKSLTTHLSEKKVAGKSIANLSDTFEFYVYNFTSSPIYLTFSPNFSGTAVQYVIVPANTLGYPVNIQEGSYYLQASSSWQSMRYLMSCGYFGSGQSYAFENVFLSDTQGCTSLDIENE
ncbi:hypothetical protein OHD16_24670 [Sphingobacterium sp. ML3W]|uniref:hypothetical protein n=1 Tax=Sphingobacterium sp. ML3W TaxID=1538644 RepID=UPI00249BBE6D|nr:hypothetical protein [Sphingobacterium sp. ML3W]WFA77901.1 hypothetical protein OGI71_17810 [Sphingobacterium sp. ML3W]